MSEVYNLMSALTATIQDFFGSIVVQTAEAYIYPEYSEDNIYLRVDVGEGKEVCVKVRLGSLEGDLK